MPDRPRKKEISVQAVCANCKKVRTMRRRGLCNDCWGDKSIRLNFHSSHPRANRSSCTDRVGEVPLAPVHTNVRPGSLAKIEVFEQRLAAGFAAVHPLDLNLRDCKLNGSGSDVSWSPPRRDEMPSWWDGPVAVDEERNTDDDYEKDVPIHEWVTQRLQKWTRQRPVLFGWLDSDGQRWLFDMPQFVRKHQPRRNRWVKRRRKPLATQELVDLFTPRLRIAMVG